MTTKDPAPPQTRVPPPARPPVPPPPRWAVRAAHVAAWSTVPSGVWRLALVLGVPVGVMGREEFLASFPDNSPLLALGYVLLLGAVAEAASYLTLGLVRPWGRWCRAGFRFSEAARSTRGSRSSPLRWEPSR